MNILILQQLDLPVDKSESHPNSGHESPTSGKNDLVPEADLSARDLDYSYVKFPPRALVHEYSYPKIQDLQTSKFSPKSRSSSGGGGGGSMTGVKKSSSAKVFGCGGGSSSASSSTSPPPPSISCTAGDDLGEKQRLHILSSQPLSIGLDDGKHSLFAPSPDNNGGGSAGQGGGTALLPAELDAFGSAGRPHCVHCRESFSLSENGRGACAEAPCKFRNAIDWVTCVRCAKGLLYHCTADSDGEYVHPCACANNDGHCARRWFGMTLLSFLLPCLCCYPPLLACYRCSRSCGFCGGKHQAASAAVK